MCLITRTRYFVNMLFFSDSNRLEYTSRAEDAWFISCGTCLVIDVPFLFPLYLTAYVAYSHSPVLRVILRTTQRVAQLENTGRFGCLTMILAILVKPKNNWNFRSRYSSACQREKTSRGATLWRSICSRPEYSVWICHDPICCLFAPFFLDRSSKREKNVIASGARRLCRGKTYWQIVSPKRYTTRIPVSAKLFLLTKFICPSTYASCPMSTGLQLEFSRCWLCPCYSPSRLSEIIFYAGSPSAYSCFNDIYAAPFRGGNFICLIKFTLACLPIKLLYIKRSSLKMFEVVWIITPLLDNIFV